MYLRAAQRHVVPHTYSFLFVSSIYIFFLFLRSMFSFFFFKARSVFASFILTLRADVECFR